MVVFAGFLAVHGAPGISPKDSKGDLELYGFSHGNPLGVGTFSPELWVSCIHLTPNSSQNVLQTHLASSATPEISSAPSLGLLEEPGKVLEFVM